MPSARYIDAEQLTQLSRLQPWRMVIAIAFDWTTIATAIVISEITRNPIVTCIAVLVIAGRMHGLGVLMHDFAHYRFIDGHKAASDYLCELVVSWPILASLGGYRRNHLAHHQHTNTERDPDWTVKIGDRRFVFPQEWYETVSTLLGYLFVFRSVADLAQIARRFSAFSASSQRSAIFRTFYYVAIVAIVSYFGGWRIFALYWLLPYFTVFFLLLYVRAVAEHMGEMDYSHELSSSRSVTPFLLERAVFCPHNVNYHLEHHLYPSVPFYNLPRLREALMQNVTYAARAHITKGYVRGLVTETVRASA